METSIRKWSNGHDNQKPKKRSSSSNDDCSTKLPNNSWDCSTPTEKGENSKKKTNDWDSSSECHETMVEPFDGNEIPKNWDSDSEPKPTGDKTGTQIFFPSSLDSFDLSNTDDEKSSVSELMGSEEGKRREEDLFVEDFEEYAKDESEKVRSNQSEGTPEDTTIWMIPNSERTRSGESTSKLISSSEKLKKFKDFFKKTKSLSDVEKSKRRTARTSRSEVSGSQKINTKLPPSEGSNLQGKLEIETKHTKSCRVSFDRTRVFFTEYECRAMTMEKDTPGAVPAAATSLLNGAEEGLAEGPGESEETVQAGPSGVMSSDNDEIGRKEYQEEAERPKAKGLTLTSESWLLLDSTGQCQTISRNEVCIFFDGRSADAVLQNREEHLIPTEALKDTASLKNTLGNMMVKESLAHVLKQDDIGGEDERKRFINLERKKENTLFYIQPGMNLTASVRIIPVDTETIHIWRRTKDAGSDLSSEMDLLDPSQDSVETGNSKLADHHSNNMRRSFVEETVTEEKETRLGTAAAAVAVGAAATTTVDSPVDAVAPELPQNQPADYSRLLLETRMIVDSLTNHFKILQNRLDGETSRNVALQGEVSKLRFLIKDSKETQSRETTLGALHGDAATSPFLLTPKTSDKAEMKSESLIEEECDGKVSISEVPSKVDQEVRDESTSTMSLKCSVNQTTDVHQEMALREESDIITVNIFTVENPAPVISCEESQETSSLIQSNLRLIENKMKRLQQENEIFMNQNVELKRKLKEISQELEKYLAGTSGQDTWIEEGRELEMLRDQVCNLKLELENMKTLSRIQEDQLTEEISLIREELTMSLFSLQDWHTAANEIFQTIETATSRLEEIGFAVDVKFDSIQDPKTFSNLLIRYVDQTTQWLVSTKEHSILYGQTLKESLPRQEIPGLDQVISGYADLIDQCRKGQMTGETKTRVMEDYLAVIMEKASLIEEMKILKTENEMLLESQLEHYEKLKQTMIALKDRKTEITALESERKLSEEEKSKMTEVLKLSEEERKRAEVESREKAKTIENLIEELRRKETEIADRNEKLKAVANEMKNLEKCCRLKDDVINGLKMKNEELLSGEETKSEQMEAFREEIARLEMQRSQLEGELNSTKILVSEAQREMTDYITHLEALVNASQDSLDKTKQKLKETNQTVSRLKNENEILDKQHQCDVKLFNSTKDELDSCREKLLKAHNKLKESEEEREKIQNNLDRVSGTAKEKSEALEVLSKEHKMVLEKNDELREKIVIFSKDKEELLSEQKELIQKYAVLSKEIQELQEKYRTVKMECNERTGLIKYLEHMLKENLLEYSNRIACLEQNISQIIEKIVACKNRMKEKHFGDDSEVRDLRHQLNVTYQERKELENVVNNYYSLMKRMENEIEEREKAMDELHDQLERQRAVECENEQSLHILVPPTNSKDSKIEELESQIAKAEEELAECRKELQRCSNNHENEKKKLELTISDLRSEIKRYQLRIEVMMRNLSNCNKNVDKRSVENSEIQEKNKIIAELTSTINMIKTEMKQKDSELENLRKKNFYQDEELRNLQNDIARLEGINRTRETQQKEKDEMAEKLFQSIKLIMEERSARQTIESLAAEKEKNYKNQVEQIKNQLLLKIKECETTWDALEEKKNLVTKLHDDLKKLKLEVASLRGQLNNSKRMRKEQEPSQVSSMTHIRPSNMSPERLESCLRELKEVRDLNLELRKTEGRYQARIVRLEDEIRDARLSIKELQGDIKTEKKSKKAFKNMILAARMEVEKCVLSKQLMAVVAERITRHLNLSEIPSRELLSGFRVSDSSNSGSNR